MKSLNLIITVVLITLLIVSCSKRPSGVLNDKQMIEVLQDIFKADGIFKNDRDRYNTNQQKDALIDGILRKHGITQTQLDKSLAWYADNIEQYSAIQDTLSARMQREFNENTTLIAKQYSYKLTGFDTDLPDYFMLDVSNPTFRFNIDSAKLTELKIEHYKLRFRAEGIDTSKHRIEASMYYKYRDTLVVDKKKLLENAFFEFAKPNIADSLLKEMYGYVHMVMATDEMPKVILNNIRNLDIEAVADSTNAPIDKQNELKPFVY